MEKRLTLEVGEKSYVIEFTRSSICKAEEVFATTLVKPNADTFGGLNLFELALLYAGLVTNSKDLKKDKVQGILGLLTGEDGYEEETLIEGLSEMLGEAISPKGGSRKKFPKGK